MPHQQVPQIKAKATVKEYKASLGKGCSQLCIGSEDDVSVRRTTLIPPPWKSNRSVGFLVLGGLLCHHTEMELARKANKISLHLSLKPRPSLSG